jgi:DNA-binding LacI/PurR family transcriptional regulator
MRKGRSNPSVTIRDIAKEAGFAASTVSIVLNNAPLARYIRSSTKQRIEDVAKKLGYSPNQLARSLRSQRNHTVGVMVFDITDPFCTPILRGIESTLYHANYVPILADAHNDPNRFERSLEMLLERRVEALIVIANWLFVDITVLADLEKRNIPTIVIGRQLTESISSVVVDNESGARLGIEHLFKLGHRKIAFIRGPKFIADSAQRWQGIRAFARSAGLKINSKLVAELPNTYDPNDAYDMAFRLTEELVRNAPPFTALMAYDDITALGAMRALVKSGVRVPEQCSVVGFDDTSPAALSLPALTTIRQPMETMGSAAVETITDAINAGLERLEFPPTHRRLPPELIVRESTCRPS